MQTDRSSRRGRTAVLVLWSLFVLVLNNPTLAAQASATQSPAPSAPGQASHATELGLPVTFERHTGDLDAMVKRGEIRALVLYSRSGFFYLNGRPEGIYYEALRAFERFVNEKLHARQHIQITFIPVRPDQIEAALTSGVGDLMAYGVVPTPEREQQVAFSLPIERNVQQIVVGGKNFGQVSSVEDLGGKKIFVNPLTTYYQNLQKVNEKLKSEGKPQILIETTDKSLMDEDLLEMVNAGLLPATVTIPQRAELWSQVLHDINAYPGAVIGTEGDLAWAMRKSNPQLKQLVDEFMKGHAVGTSFGDTLIREYLQSGSLLKDATSQEEMKKFDQTVGFFKQYASQFGFDYLMIVAQGYQESMLNQAARSPGGAVGIMQVMPSTAAAPPISIPDILTAENNIHAGVKILHQIADEYFNDPAIDSKNRLLFTFAAYNAGPNRIAELRRRAPAHGLDPNKWFGNVELLVAEDVGPVTVHYVSNIYKYYVAYQLVVQQGESL